MLKKNFLIAIVAILGFMAIASQETEAKPTLYSHTAIGKDGIAYHHYTEINDDGTITLFTTWIGSNGEGMRIDVWLFPKPPMNNINISTVIGKIDGYEQTQMVTIAGANSDVTYIEGANSHKVRITTTPNRLYLSNAKGTAEVVDPRTGNLILSDIEVTEELREVKLPSDINFQTPYVLVFTNENGCKETKAFYFTLEGVELQTK